MHQSGVINEPQSSGNRTRSCEEDSAQIESNVPSPSTSRQSQDISLVKVLPLKVHCCDSAPVQGASLTLLVAAARHQVSPLTSVWSSDVAAVCVRA